MTFRTPSGMSRRHFLSHLAGASAMAVPALTLGHSLRTHAAELKKNHKAAILLWILVVSIVMFLRGVPTARAI